MKQNEFDKRMRMEEASRFEGKCNERNLDEMLDKLKKDLHDKLDSEGGAHAVHEAVKACNDAITKLCSEHEVIDHIALVIDTDFGISAMGHVTPGRHVPRCKEMQGAMKEVIANMEKDWHGDSPKACIESQIKKEFKSHMDDEDVQQALKGILSQVSKSFKDEMEEIMTKRVPDTMAQLAVIALADSDKDFKIKVRRELGYYADIAVNTELTEDSMAMANLLAQLAQGALTFRSLYLHTETPTLEDAQALIREFADLEEGDD